MKPTRTINLYLDPERTKWWEVEFIHSEKTIAGLMLNMNNICRTSQPGRPWECIMANCIMGEVKKNPKLFPHPVLHAYVINSAVYLIDKLKRDSPTGKNVPVHAVRYRFEQGPVARLYDKENAKHGPEVALEAVKTYVGTEPIRFSLMRSQSRRDGSPSGPKRGHVGSKPGSRTHHVSQGAKARAENAGLLVA